ncbi:hypothetical protein [Selenomonas ruminantium]|uniref:hypothetical protein n=1 Tax=Selenomonas ruminantium TaxID=971 RepID=UPI0012FEFC31|nr:hypothetical protein [Selenomonas ruminantium]
MFVAGNVAEICLFIADGGDIGIGGQLPLSTFYQADVSGIGLIVVVDGAGERTPPIEAGASCFDENSTTAPRNCGDLHSLHRRRFPCDPRYYKLR